MRALWTAVSSIATAMAVAIASAPLPARAEGAEPRVAKVVCAAHVGRVGDGVVRWRSTYHLAAGEALATGPVRIVLARPTSAGALTTLTTLTTEGRVVTDAAGDVVAIDFAHRQPIVLSTTERVGAIDTVERLTPPLSAGEGTHIVQVVGADELRFEPGVEEGFERRDAAIVATYLSDGERLACEALTAGDRDAPTPGASDAPRVEFRAGPRSIDGLRGVLTTASSRRRPVVFLVTGACVALLAGLAIGYRKLARAAKVEVAEAALEEDFAQLARRHHAQAPRA